ncbi:uncharacterized protein RAG0_07553 [Rhynchosporium agropyri]|uniref:Uncharacterized protein n=3 Tax=Rhynchosporium TaxID=38037 RepID=A0A1E1MDA1_RHYSE|nr:uncharacterized protein RCO7_14357 [Rhynchosporium commune]CZS99068.1 uncharacterized protein RAG0_07553 [Rhynchosporium agropyri]CZT47038.1 uncharacterized protein RSE6_07561 [Rhynchosporium secalis]
MPRAHPGASAGQGFVDQNGSTCQALDAVQPSQSLCSMPLLMQARCGGNGLPRAPRRLERPTRR